MRRDPSQVKTARKACSRLSAGRKRGWDVVWIACNSGGRLTFWLMGISLHRGASHRDFYSCIILVQLRVVYLCILNQNKRRLENAVTPRDKRNRLSVWSNLDVVLRPLPFNHSGSRKIFLMKQNFRNSSSSILSFVPGMFGSRTWSSSVLLYQFTNFLYLAESCGWVQKKHC